MSEGFTFATTRLGLLLEQYETSYTMLRERLEGLTNEEYFWEPTPGSWNIRRRGEVRTAQMTGKGDWVHEQNRPEPTPAPMTTIAWRIGHLVGTQMLRCDYTFGSKFLQEDDIEYPGNAADALTFLEQSHHAWHTGLTGLSETDLDVVGLSTYPHGLDPQIPFGPLIWWTNRELIHHGGEIGLLRDLWQLRA